MKDLASALRRAQDENYPPSYFFSVLMQLARDVGRILQKEYGVDISLRWGTYLRAMKPKSMKLEVWFALDFLRDTRAIAAQHVPYWFIVREWEKVINAFEVVAAEYPVVEEFAKQRRPTLNEDETRLRLLGS